MKIKFCLPIITSSAKEVLGTINKFSGYDFYEIWFDYLKDDPNDILKNANKLIFCFRRQGGEEIKMKIDKRKKIIESLNGKNILVDCDIEKQIEDLDFIQKEKLKIKTIVSYHNYNETPSNKELDNIIKSMEKFNPEIFKIAAFSSNSEDAVRLMDLLIQLKKRGKRAIVIGMGELGRETRIFGATHGNEFNFVRTEKTKTAPGQFTKAELENIIGIHKFMIHNS